MTADEIDESFVPRARSGVAGVELDGETVLLDDDTGAMHTLNPTATVLWDCFDGSGTLAEIAADVADAYSTDQSIVVGDMLELARALGRQGLLDGVEADPPAEITGSGHDRQHTHHEHAHQHHHDHNGNDQGQGGDVGA